MMLPSNVLSNSIKPSRSEAFHKEPHSGTILTITSARPPSRRVQITPLREITASRRSIPRGLSRVETLRCDVTASNFDTVIVEEYPALGPAAALPGSNDLVREGSLLWRLEHYTHARTAFSGDVAHQPEIAVVEADYRGTGSADKTAAPRSSIGMPV